jgi:conjugal transfer pilus assembly protein TraL
MDEMEPVQIPRHLDMPHTLLLWSADELIPFLALLGIGLFVGAMPVCIALGVGFMYLYRRFRDSRPDGYMLHALYWSGLMPIKAPSAINPFHREILP